MRVQPSTQLSDRLYWVALHVWTDRLRCDLTSACFRRGNAMLDRTSLQFSQPGAGRCPPAGRSVMRAMLYTCWNRALEMWRVRLRSWVFSAHHFASFNLNLDKCMVRAGQLWLRQDCLTQNGFLLLPSLLPHSLSLPSGGCLSILSSTPWLLHTARGQSGP